MAINRAPFNALIDDDGTGLTGSVWNKAAIQSVLLDPIDALIASGVKPIVVNSTSTGVQNAFAPGLGDDTVILWNGAADMTLNGMAGGVTARRVTIKNLSSANVYVTQDSGAAAAGTHFANMVTSGPTPIGTGGAATWVYDGVFWRLVAHEQGAAITPPYNAADFSANTGTWTCSAGNVAVCRYTLKGRRLFFDFAWTFTITTGSPTQLRRTLPNGYTSAVVGSWLAPTAIVYDSGTTVMAIVVPQGTYFYLQKTIDAAAWSNYTSMHVAGSVGIDIN